MILGWSQGADPERSASGTPARYKAGQNQTGYQNAAVDRALEAGRTSCGQTSGRSVQASQRQLNQDQPYNFGFAANTLLFVNKKFQGVAPGPFPNIQNSYLWNVEQWWVKP